MLPFQSMTLDTLTIARRLQNAGVTQKLAEEQAQILRDVVEQGAATKADIAEIRQEIAELKVFLLKLIGASSTAIVGILAAIRYFG